jgi:hypothetical protein
VVGTLGDDRADRSVRAQAELVRALLVGATIVSDSSIDVAAGPSAWPARPIVYGGSHVSSVVARLGPVLPVAVGSETIVAGGETFGGRGHRLIAAIPARDGDARGPGHPAFILYAGTGTPGVVDINSLRHGAEPLLIGDAFGRLRAGSWTRDGSGAVTARLGPAASRIEWRAIERTVAGGPVTISFPQQLAPAADEGAVVDAIVRGLSTSAARLELAPPPPVHAYVYPDRRSKQSLTGDAGDGHAVALAGALHVIRFDPAPGGPLELLVAHEGTHVYAGEAWGATASPFLGEGLAVWASGHYGGRPLADWARSIAERPTATSMFGPRAFRGRPEAESYPLAGLFVTAVVAEVGLGALRDHLYGAPADRWADACTRAGTTPDALQAAFSRR